MNVSAKEESIPNLALVSYDSLGDGLLYLMMAQNLRRNGFRVTYYGHLIAHLKAWLPDLQVKPYPDCGTLLTELDSYDLVLCCPPSFMRHEWPKQELEKMAQRYVMFCQKAPAYWQVNHTERIKKQCAAQFQEKLLAFAACSGKIRGKDDSPDDCVVDIMLKFMKEKMGLDNLDKKIQFNFPAGLQHRRNLKRIIISPDSAGPQKKDWSPKRFMTLAAKLKGLGYEPIIVVAPGNHEYWRTLPDNKFATPKFPDIAQLAAYIYESGAVVANDSGNGHLASALNIPTITIYRKKDSNFTWRPGWGPGKVIIPSFTVKLLKKRIWRPFISISRIIKAVDAVTG